MSILQTMQLAFGQTVRGGRAESDASRLDPRYRYLRLTHDGGVAFLLLNFEDRHPNGAVQVWYSGDRHVFRFQNGRLVGNTGFLPEWRAVNGPQLPSWSALAGQSMPFSWERTRDVMPGYRFGLRDKLVLSRVAPPRSSSLVGIDAQRLVWFEERTEPGSSEMLPPARYAVDGDNVIYGEQCVSPQNCFKWQRWPAGA